MTASLVHPDVTGFFDRETSTISYVVKDPASSACAIIDAVMDFDYAKRFKAEPLEAYGPLIIDAMRGDQSLYKHRYEVEGAWRFIDLIENAWHAAGPQPPLCEYPAGSWGPKEADELLARDGRTWRRM